MRLKTFYTWGGGGGDFNCTQDDLLDRNHLEPHPASQASLIRMIETHNLVDVWRRTHSKERQYTWSRKGNIVSLARLDRFYCFKHHFNTFYECKMMPVGFTDHALVLCCVMINDVRPRSAYWHFNNSLLHDKHFKEAFIFLWSILKSEKQQFSSLRQWWDCSKVEVKQWCHQHTLNVTKVNTRSMEDLESGIVELQGLADSTGNREHIEALKTKKIALKDLLSTKAQGALVRSRFQSINEMDAPTSFFFGLEKKQNQSRSIHSLLSDDGQELTEPSQIRKRAVDFYSALYRSEYKEHEKYAVFCDNLPQVSTRSNANLGKPLSLQELHSALMNMQGGKAPGIDGLTVEFYKAFWDVIGEDLMAVLNESLAVGLLPLSCRRAVITLLPKKGNLQDIKNWRPVSLLCTEYKILSKALANRVKGVMDQVIHQDQTYCVPGRSIRDNVHLIRDVLDLSSSLGLDVGLISMDQEKAFDRVEHQYLWKVMESFGFNADLIAMIKVLYQDIESVLKFNGGLCAPFKVQRGVRQGCGCSAMLYAISIEPFLQSTAPH